MNYLLKSKPKNKFDPRYYAVIICFVLLLGLGWFFDGSVRTVFYYVSKPVWVVGESVAKPFVKISDFFSYKNNLINEKKQLEEELSVLKMKEVDYDILFAENQNLKNLLSREVSRDRTLARVLSKPPRSPYDTLVIDIGSENGITLGDRVYLSDNIIIGLVKNITPKTSLVELFSSSGQQVEAVSQRTGASFTLVGTGGANMELEVPKDTDIVWGDMFIYPAISPYVMAQVNYIDDSSQSSFKTIYLKTLGNVFEAKWVFVDQK
jgi:cell shape-determining protein MreC